MKKVLRVIVGAISSPLFCILLALAIGLFVIVVDTPFYKDSHTNIKVAISIAFGMLVCALFMFSRKAKKPDDDIDVLVKNLMNTKNEDTNTTRASDSRRSQNNPDESSRQNEIPKAQENIILLMTNNMKEIRAYFKISKNHARLSFWLAILNCVVGIGLLCYAVYNTLYSTEILTAILPAIAGAIAEIFAGTSLIVHKKSLAQLNHYYDALHENEMVLLTLHLVGNISQEKQDEIFIEIIRSEMNLRYQTAINKSLPTGSPTAASQNTTPLSP